MYYLGRQFGFKSGYRSNHVFELPDDVRKLRAHIGDIVFDDQELVAKILEHFKIDIDVEEAIRERDW